MSSSTEVALRLSLNGTKLSNALTSDKKTAEAESLLSAQASSVLVRMSAVAQSRRPDRAPRR
jgi:hypothetical protein